MSHLNYQNSDQNEQDAREKEVIVLVETKSRMKSRLGRFRPRSTASKN